MKPEPLREKSREGFCLFGLFHNAAASVESRRTVIQNYTE